MAKSRSALTVDLELAIGRMLRFAPYSTGGEFKPWKSAMRDLMDVKAMLDLIDQFRPAILDALASAACEEQQANRIDSCPEIGELVRRFTGRVRAKP